MALALASLPAAFAEEAVRDEAQAPTLGEMKIEFAMLMNERAGLAKKVQESQKIISDARATTGSDATSSAYREAVQRVEQALDEHPKIKRILARHAEAQAEQADISRQQAVILDAWNQAKVERSQEFKAASEQAVAKAETERQAILKQAGAKEVGKLSEADRLKVKESHRRMTNELAIARADYTRVSATNAVQAAREADGSAARFQEINARHAEIERERSGIQDEMMRLRTTLRTSDQEIAKLQQAAREASQAHVATQDARPEVVAARVFITDVNTRREAIDTRARVLRQAILTGDPECKADLDKLSAAAGLNQAGEDFWKIK
jgi:chromosome segregation ATPase